MIYKLIFMLMTIVITIFIYDVFDLLEKRKQMKKLSKVIKRRKDKNKYQGLLKITEKLLGWYGNKEKVQYRLSRAGNPKYLGESTAHFYASKLILAAFLALFAGETEISRIVYGFLGFMVPDGLIWLGGKKRQNDIKEQLPEMIDFLKKSLAGEAKMPETLAALSQKVSSPLKEEVMRLGAYYNMTYNLDEALNDFAKRIKLEEVDNLVLALKQAEETGRVKKILVQQADMLKKRLYFEQKKSTQNKANFLPLVQVLIVINIFLLVVTPMFLKFLNASLFNL